MAGKEVRRTGCIKAVPSAGICLLLQHVPIRPDRIAPASAAFRRGPVVSTADQDQRVDFEQTARQVAGVATDPTHSNRSNRPPASLFRASGHRKLCWARHTPPDAVASSSVGRFDCGSLIRSSIFMDGDAPSKVGYGRETGENMLSSQFTAHDPEETFSGTLLIATSVMPTRFAKCGTARRLPSRSPNHPIFLFARRRRSRRSIRCPRRRSWPPRGDWA